MWGTVLGERYSGLLARLLRSLDVLGEERGRGPGGPGPSPILDAETLAQPGEIEAFSPDSDWMPRVVLVAKSTYVWLSSSSAASGARCAASTRSRTRRSTSLPLRVQRPVADRAVAAQRGVADASSSAAARSTRVASAYALYDYVVADDLGGEAALARPRGAGRPRRASAWPATWCPTTSASTARWVIEHPEWFVQLDHPPYPGYRFDGPDLSSNPAMAVIDRGPLLGRQ